MGPQPVGHGYGDAFYLGDLELEEGFNGATTCRSWIQVTGSRFLKRDKVFQWGHNLSVMDTWRSFSQRTPQS